MHLFTSFLLPDLLKYCKEPPVKVALEINIIARILRTSSLQTPAGSHPSAVTPGAGPASRARPPRCVWTIPSLSTRGPTSLPRPSTVQTVRTSSPSLSPRETRPCSRTSIYPSSRLSCGAATRAVGPRTRLVSAFVSPQSALYTTVTGLSGNGIEMRPQDS